jgi:hypothetical protein
MGTLEYLINRLKKLVNPLQWRAQCANQKEKWKENYMARLRTTILLLSMLMASTGCSEFALLASGTSVAINNNVYAKVYSGTDVLTIMYTEKDIKTHTYERIRKTIQEGN